jgi:hypothetical protein
MRVATATAVIPTENTLAGSVAEHSTWYRLPNADLVKVLGIYPAA